MKWTIKFEKTANYFHVKNEGIYEKGDSIRLYKDIFSNKFWKPGSFILMDYRDVDFYHVNYEAMREASLNLALHEKQIAGTKIAYLTSSVKGYGVTRQFQMLVEGKVSAQIGTFSEEKEAVRWLTSKNDPPEETSLLK